MTTQTYLTQAFVLKKIKLSESDLIVSLLGADGSQIRVVAKGARKPSSIFAARLELFNEVKLLLVPGRNLDTVKEVSLLKSFESARKSPEHMMLFALACELLLKVTQPALCHEQLYKLTSAAFFQIDTQEKDQALVILTAFVLKLCAFVGIKPETRFCVMCGSDLREVRQQKASLSGGMLAQNNVSFSFSEGGGLCMQCVREGSFQGVSRLNTALFAWMDVFLYSKFSELLERKVPEVVCVELLRFSGKWLEEHMQVRLKSLDCVLQGGYF